MRWSFLALHMINAWATIEGDSPYGEWNVKK